MHNIFYVVDNQFEEKQSLKQSSRRKYFQFKL